MCRDHTRGLEYIYSGRQLAQEGLHAELDGYQNRVLLDFREVRDMDGTWEALARDLGGQGVPNMNEAHREIILKPMRDALRQALNPVLLKALFSGGSEAMTDVEARRVFVGAMTGFLSALQEQLIKPLDLDAALREILRSVDAVQQARDQIHSLGADRNVVDYLRETGEAAAVSPETWWIVPSLWAVLAPLGEAVSQSELQARTAAWMDEWPVTRVVYDVYRELGLDHTQAMLGTALPNSCCATARRSS